MIACKRRALQERAAGRRDEIEITVGREWLRVFAGDEITQALIDARRELFGAALMLMKAFPLQALVSLMDQGGGRQRQGDEEQSQHDT